MNLLQVPCNMSVSHDQSVSQTPRAHSVVLVMSLNYMLQSFGNFGALLKKKVLGCCCFFFFLQSSPRYCSFAVLCFYPYIPEQLSEQVLASAGPDRGILSDLCLHIYADSNHSLCSEPSLGVGCPCMSSCLAPLLLEVPLGAHTQLHPTPELQ